MVRIELEATFNVCINIYINMELCIRTSYIIFFKASITITLPGDVWTLLQIGLGGYVVGRSAESVARTMANKPVANKEQENG